MVVLDNRTEIRIMSILNNSITSRLNYRKFYGILQQKIAGSLLLIMICLQLSNVLLYLRFVFIVFYVSNLKIIWLASTNDISQKETIDSKTLCGILRQKIAGSMLLIICLQLSNVLLYIQFIFIVFYVSNLKIIWLASTNDISQKETIDSKTLCGILRQKIAGSMLLIMIYLQLSSVSLYFYFIFFLCLFRVRESNVTSIRIGRMCQNIRNQFQGGQTKQCGNDLRIFAGVKWPQKTAKYPQNSTKIHKTRYINLWYIM